ncbi:hypothetical protein [Pantoea sp. BAV 3049]|uniref:hypothetical protein n=1 Tax=Pantoea sp. BAV 3049 TaxID=2654188 RepID=UPI00131BC635|nr:hypothetical protein [Pantoea sp. BAV 3049]
MQTSANTGSQIIAMEAQVSIRYILLLRQPAGSPCAVPEFSRPTIPADISALYLTGCGLHCRQALLPRDRESAPDIFSALQHSGASLCPAQSGRVTHDAFSTCTRHLNFASS